MLRITALVRGPDLYNHATGKRIERPPDSVALLAGLGAMTHGSPQVKLAYDAAAVVERGILWPKAVVLYRSAQAQGRQGQIRKEGWRKNRKVRRGNVDFYVCGEFREATIRETPRSKGACQRILSTCPRRFFRVGAWEAPPEIGLSLV